MDRAAFERLVAEAVESLPENLKPWMDNVAVVVEDYPAPGTEPRHRRGDDLLLGLYEGQPLTERDSHSGVVFPDKISIYQRNIEAVCRNAAEIRDEVRKTVLHEIAHHFGIDDDHLDDLGY